MHLLNVITPCYNLCICDAKQDKSKFSQTRFFFVHQYPKSEYRNSTYVRKQLNQKNDWFAEGSRESNITSFFVDEQKNNMVSFERI